MAKGKGRGKKRIKKDSQKAAFPLFDENGNLRLHFYLTSEGCPQIALYGNDGCERLVLGVHSDNTPFITLRDADRGSAGVAFDTDGHIRAGIKGDKGFPSYSEDIDPSGERHCKVVDANGLMTFLLRTPASGAEVLSGPPKRG